MNQKVLHLDCQSGISGDMFVAAAIDLGVPFQVIQDSVDGLNIDGVSVSCDGVKRRGFAARSFQVHYPEQHHHRHLNDIKKIIENAVLPAPVKQLSIDIFRRLGMAEAKVHGTTLEKVHFHEVGGVDSIVDIVASAVAIDWLSVERITCSEISVGHGSIEIAHGPVSLPAPATAELLTDIPVRATQIPYELTTPTGAAIAGELANHFGFMPSMKISAIGYGGGTRDLAEQANLLRMFLGTLFEQESSARHSVVPDPVVVMETNIDHVSGEIIGHCLERLIACGALDAYAQPIQMKKNRPAVKLTVLCRELDASNLEKVLFEESGTLGIRHWIAARSTLDRSELVVATAFGPIRGQLVRLPGGDHRFSPEFECCKRIGQEHSIPVVDIMTLAIQSFDNSFANSSNDT